MRCEMRRREALLLLATAGCAADELARHDDSEGGAPVGLGIGMGLGIGKGGGAAQLDPADLITDGFWLSGSFDPNGIALGVDPDIALWDCKAGFATFGGFSTATASQRPHVETIGAKTMAVFDSANVNRIRSNKAASVWKALHAPAGGTLRVVARIDSSTGTIQRLFDTNSAGNVNQHGASLQYNSASNIVNFSTTNAQGSAHMSSSIDLDNISLGLGDLWLLQVEYSDLAGYRMSINGLGEVTGTVSGASSTTNPTGALRFGTYSTGEAAQWLDGAIGEVFFEPGILPNADLDALDAVLAAKYAIPLP